MIRIINWKLLAVGLLLSTVMITNSQTSLQDLFSDSSCINACLLTIEPGRTNVAELQEILRDQNIAWNREVLGLPRSPVVVYSVSSTSFPAPIDQNSEILFWAGQTMETLIGTIQIPIEPISINHVILEYGSPTIVSQDDALTVLVYQSLGITFVVSPEDNEMVTKVNIRSPENITQYYIEGGMVGVVIPCSDPMQSCGIATATPIPAIHCTWTIAHTLDLVNAITSANATPEADTICLEAGTYTLDAPITSEITLVGLGAGAEIIGTLQVSGAGQLTLRNVSVNP